MLSFILFSYIKKKIIHLSKHIDKHFKDIVAFACFINYLCFLFSKMYLLVIDIKIHFATEAMLLIQLIHIDVAHVFGYKHNLRQQKCTAVQNS